MQDSQRVVVTGLGVVTPIGLEETEFWQNLMAGRSGIRRLRAVNPEEFKSPNGAEVDNERLAASLDALGWKPFDRAVDMAVLSAAQALGQAGLIPAQPPCTPQPVAVIFGTGNGPTPSVAESFANYAVKGLKGIRPTTVPRCMINAIPSQISMKFRLTGMNYAIASACSSSTIALGIGFRMIRDGYARQVLCGGAEALFNTGIYGAWNNLGVMSRNPDPARSARPFDRDRDGFVMGEGAAALLLESLAGAKQRRARIRGEIVGYGESSDAEHITHPSPEGQSRAIRAALASAVVQPEEIGFINAHGTGTKTNDECESISIHKVFGEFADRIPVASNKSFFGHLVGGAGAVETIATLLGLANGRVPPNLNLDHPDPACPLHFVGATPLAVPGPLAMKNSFGFGGSNAVLILRRYDAS